MNRSTLNYLIDTLGLLVMLGLVVTGLIMEFVLPPGSGGRGLAVRDLGRHDWGEIHFWLAVGMAAVLIVHVVLHWSWVVSTTERVVLRRNGAGGGKGASGRLVASALVLLVVGVVGGAVWLADSSVTVTPGSGRGHGARHCRGRDHARQSPQSRADDDGSRQGHDRDDHGPDHDTAVRTSDGRPIDTKGHMTLSDVAAASGIPVERLIGRIGLPADVDTGERLGRLMRGRGKTMADVRQALAANCSASSRPPAAVHPPSPCPRSCRRPEGHRRQRRAGWQRSIGQVTAVGRAG